MIGCAVKVAKIATGEVQEDASKPSMRKGGLKGGVARAKKLTPEQRHEIAALAASARWKKAEN